MNETATPNISQSKQEILRFHHQTLNKSIRLDTHILIPCRCFQTTHLHCILHTLYSISSLFLYITQFSVLHTLTISISSSRGSLASPAPPPPSPENSGIDYRAYASFCPKEPIPNTNLCNRIECYDLSTNSWNQVGPIPGLMNNHVLKGFAMVAIGESMYIIGGRLCLKQWGQGSDEFNEVDIEVLPIVMRYNLRDETWSTCARLGIQRFDFACTVCDSKIYVAGGHSELASARGISSAEEYDPELDVWTPLPKMTTLRYKCVGVTWQGKMHVFGGFIERDDSVSNFMLRSSAEVFDMSCGQWDFMRGMWQLDIPPNQIVAVNGRLFSSGDCLNAWKGHIESYNGKLNIWNIVNGSHGRTMSSLDATEGDMIPKQKLYLTMAPIGTCLYFLAGYRTSGDPATSTSIVHRFDTSGARDPWRSFEPTEQEGVKRTMCPLLCCSTLIAGLY